MDRNGGGPPRMREQRPVCRFFLRGICNKGPSCAFRHVLDDPSAMPPLSGGMGGLPAPSLKNVVCKHWLRGLCKKADTCEFLHVFDLTRMPECTQFSKYGVCTNPECYFLHANPEEKSRECPWYNRGFCKHGLKCRHRHIRRVPCPAYLAGFCPEGSECKMGHPKFETPRTGDDAGGAHFTSGTRGEHLGATALLVGGGMGGRSAIVCHKCGQHGHKMASCPMNMGAAANATAAAPPPPPPQQHFAQQMYQMQAPQEGMMSSAHGQDSAMPPPPPPQPASAEQLSS